MGSGPSSHLYNSTGQNARVSLWGRGAYLNPGQTVKQDYKGDGEPYTSVELIDHKHRVVKGVRFAVHIDRRRPMPRDILEMMDRSWIIRGDGVIRQKHGASLSTQDPRGPWYRWDFDHTAYYANKDREEEAARQREAERRAKEEEKRRKEEEKRRKQEEERRDAEERCIRADAVSAEIRLLEKNKWKEELTKSQHSQELEEFSETSSKYVSNSKGDSSGTAQQPGVATSLAEKNPLMLLLEKCVHEYFMLQGEKIDKDIGASAKSEMLKKIEDEDDLFFGYSSKAVQFQCFETFRYIVADMRQPTDVLVAFINAFETILQEYKDLPGSEKDEEVEYKMAMMMNSVTGTWNLRVKYMSLPEIKKILFDDTEPPRSFCINIVYPIRDAHNFPENPETWPLFAALIGIRDPLARSEFVVDFCKQKVANTKYTGIDPEHRHPFLELLYNVVFQEKDNNRFNRRPEVIQFFLETAEYLSSLHNYEAGSDPVVETDTVGEAWTLKFVLKLLSHNTIRRVWNPISHGFLKFCVKTRQHINEDMVNYICEAFRTIAPLGPHLETPEIQGHTETMAELLVQAGDHSGWNVNWVEPPDFIVLCFIRGSHRVNHESRETLLKCAAKLKGYLHKITSNTFNLIESWFDDHGMDDLSLTRQVIQLCGIILSDHNISGIEGNYQKWLVKHAGAFSEKLLRKLISPEIEENVGTEVIVDTIKTYGITMKRGFTVDQDFLQQLFNHLLQLQGPDDKVVARNLFDAMRQTCSASSYAQFATFWSSNVPNLIEFGKKGENATDLSIIGAIRLLCLLWEWQVSSPDFDPLYIQEEALILLNRILETTGPYLSPAYDVINAVSELMSLLGFNSPSQSQIPVLDNFVVRMMTDTWKSGESPVFFLLTKTPIMNGIQSKTKLLLALASILLTPPVQPLSSNENLPNSSNGLSEKEFIFCHKVFMTLMMNIDLEEKEEMQIYEEVTKTIHQIIQMGLDVMCVALSAELILRLITILKDKEELLGEFKSLVLTKEVFLLARTHLGHALATFQHKEYQSLLRLLLYFGNTYIDTDPVLEVDGDAADADNDVNLADALPRNSSELVEAIDNLAHECFGVDVTVDPTVAEESLNFILNLIAKLQEVPSGESQLLSVLQCLVNLVRKALGQGIPIKIEVLQTMSLGAKPNPSISEEIRNECSDALLHYFRSRSFYNSMMNGGDFPDGIVELMNFLTAEDDQGSQLYELAAHIQFKLWLFSTPTPNVEFPSSIEGVQDSFYKEMVNKDMVLEMQISPLKLEEGWFFQWAMLDTIDVEAFLKWGSSSATVPVDAGILGCCTLAQFYFDVGDVLTGESWHLSCLKSILGSTSVDEMLDFNSVLEMASALEEVPNGTSNSLGWLLLHRSFTLVKSGNLKAVGCLINHAAAVNVCDEGTFDGLMECIDNVRFLLELMTSATAPAIDEEAAVEAAVEQSVNSEVLEENGGDTDPKKELIRSKLFQLKEMLHPMGPKRDRHIETLCSKLGSLVAIGGESEHVVEFVLDFCLSLGDWYDCNVVETFPVSSWAEQLIKSEVLCKLSQSLGGDCSPEIENNLHQLLDSLLMYHRHVHGENEEKYTLLRRLHELTRKFLNNDIELTDAKDVATAYYSSTLLLHQDLVSQDIDFQSPLDLQKYWLVDKLKLDLALIENATVSNLWEELCNSDFFERADNALFLMEFFTLAAKSSPSVEKVLNFIIFQKGRKLNYINSIKSLLNSRDGGCFDLAHVQSRTEAILVEMELQKIVELIAAPILENEKALEDPKGQRLLFMHANCQLLFSRIISPQFPEWGYQELMQLLQTIEAKSKTHKSEDNNPPHNEILADIAQTVSGIYSFRLTPEKILEELEAAHIPMWPSLISNYYSEKIVAGELKSLEVIYTELQSLNEPAVLSNLDDVQATLANMEELEWSEAEILSWAQDRAGREGCSPGKIISVLSQVVNLHCGYRPRDTQLVSMVILLLKNTSTGGRLARISTGEGKSVIVAMLAAYKALEGHTVDIVTSSPILAQRDAAEFAKFYRMLGLTVDSVQDDNPQKEKGVHRMCYLATVLYSDASSLQGDVLRHEFSLLNTRGGRGYDIVIVDEVDCMLIDQGGHSTRLVDKMPGMEQMEAVFVAIWAHMSATISSILTLPDSCQYHMSELPNGAGWLDAVGSVISKKLTIGTISEFAMDARDREKSDENAREAIALMIQTSAIPLTTTREYLREKVGQIIAAGETIEPSKHGWIINEVIDSRWITDSDITKLQTVEKMIGAEVRIYSINKERGDISLCPRFHNCDEESVESTLDYQTKHKFLFLSDKLLKLTLVQDYMTFVKSTVSSKVRDIFEFSSGSYVPVQEDPSLRVKLPHHLAPLFYTKLPKWIDSALTATLKVQDNRDYLIKQDFDNVTRIVPIDYESTGVIQEGTVWSDGLHQFLQLKHQLSLTPENLATNFLSNMSYFQRYRGHIYGLTGTLGSSPEKNLLSTIYQVDTVDVPTFKVKQLNLLTDIITPSTDHWLSAIATSVLLHSRTRAVLVICRSISDVHKIERYLHLHVAKVKTDISKYTRSDLDSETESVTSKKLGKGGVVIATNLAGRGTDIKLTEEVVASGGLHVCITFLPTNLRVEEQAAGRAARQGQPGSSQLVLNSEVDLMDISYQLRNPVNPSPDEVKEQRDIGELERIRSVEKETIPTLLTQESAFRTYCEMRARVKQSLPKDDHITLAAVDEKWGLMLDIANTNSTPSSFSAASSRFLNTLNWIDNPNPYYFILRGNDFNCKDKYDDAIKSFQIAIAKDGAFVANAHYYMAYSIINRFKGDDYKEEAGECLKKSAYLVGNVVIPTLLMMHNMGSPRDDAGNTRNFKELQSNGKEIVRYAAEDSEFTKQIANKISLFQVQLKSVEEAMGKLGEYKEVEAEMVGVENYFEEKGVPPPTAEISEFRAMGMCAFIKIVKKPPPWYAVLVVILMGVVQAVAGAALAICTGGAFGTGFITDGVGDIVKGVKAAVNGEYISLGEFFKEKGISLAISAVAAVAGAFLSSAAGAIKTFAVNMGTKFANTAFGKMAITLGTSVKDWAVKMGTKAKDWAIKAGDWFAKMGTSAKGSMSSFFSNMAEKGKNLAVTLKLDKAWDYLKKGWNYVSKKVQSGYEKVKNAFSSMLSSEQQAQLKLAGKLIGYEVAKTGLMEGMQFILSKAVLEPLTEAVRKKLKEQLYADITRLLKEPNCLGTIREFLKPATGKESFDALWTSIQIHGNQAAANFSTDQSDTARFTMDALGKFAEESKRIMGNEKNKMGHRNIIATVVDVSITIALESAKFGLVVSKLANYLPTVMEQLQVGLRKQIGTRDDSKTSSEPYCLTDKGRLDTNALIIIVADSMAEIMAANMAALIESGILCPPFEIGAGKLAELLNPIKQSDVLEDIEKYNYGKDGRANNASIWNVMRKKDPPADLSSDDKKLIERKDGFNMDARNPLFRKDAFNMDGKIAYERKNAFNLGTFDRKDALNSKNELGNVSETLGRPIQIYTSDMAGSSLEFDYSIGTNINSGGASAPLKLFTRDGVNFDPLVMDKDTGRPRILNLPTSYNSLYASSLVGLASMENISQMKMANLMYNMRRASYSNFGLSGYRIRDMNVLNKSF